jgi:hypothetical protein
MKVSKKNPKNIKLVTPHLGTKPPLAFDARKVSISNQKMNSNIVVSKFESKEHRPSIRLSALDSGDLGAKKIPTKTITNFRPVKVVSQAPRLRPSRKTIIPGSLNEKINKAPVYKPKLFSDGSSIASSSSSLHLKGDVQNLKVSELDVAKQMILTANVR